MYLVKDNTKFWDMVDKGKGKRITVTRIPANGVTGELVEILAVIDGNKIYTAYRWPEVLGHIWAAAKA